MAKQLGFIGGGRMAEALAGALIKAKYCPATNIIIGEKLKARRTQLAKALKVRTTAHNTEVVGGADVIILAVKPYIVPDVLSDILSAVKADHLIVSIAAGVPTRLIEASLPGKPRVVRVMPNNPCLVGAAASGYSRGKHATQRDANVVARIFNTVGIALEVKESLLDAVTGLSGSGPAYIYTVIEALTQGGVAMGLKRKDALTLAAQTVLGAGRLVIESGRSPADLRDGVTTPGGTTVEGLKVLDDANVPQAFIDAVKAATDRSKELGKAK